MTKGQRVVLEFGLPDDPVTSFMSNSSFYGFELEGVMWPSVEHFILAKRFPDTALESKIRHSESIRKAQLLSRSKIQVEEIDGWVVKKRVYPDREDPEWESKIPSLLEKALLAKFSSTRLLAKLLTTGEAHLVDVSKTSMAQYTGGILERIRSRAKLSKSPNVAATLVFPEGDLSFTDFNDETREMFERIFKLLTRIRIEDGQRVVYPEMMEDAIFNITPSLNIDEKSLQDELIKMVMKPPSWSEMFITTPNFRTLLEKVKDEYSIESNLAHIMLRLLRWILLTPESSHIRSYAVTRLNNVDDIEIIFPPKRRTYRGEVPPCPLLIPRSNVNVVEGDLINFSLCAEGVEEGDDNVFLGVVGQTTCTKLRLPGGVTEAVYETFPYANVYSINTATKGGKGFELGSVVVSRPRHIETDEVLPSSIIHRNIATFFCEVGNQRASSPHPIGYDSQDNRKKWFQDALKQFCKEHRGAVLAFSRSSVEPYGDVLARCTPYSNGVTIYLVDGVVASRHASPLVATSPLSRRIDPVVASEIRYARTVAPLNLSTKDAKDTIKKLSRDEPHRRVHKDIVSELSAK